MSYQVIARKYRPQKFSDVVGQEHVTRTLSQAIAQKRIAHAYIFCGPRGTGKTTVARIFAKCLNCTDGPKIEFDDQDPRCKEIAEGRSLDVMEIDGASNNGVEQVRELRDTCKYAPASSRFKIYIIDEVHMLSAAAFNALLKTLEEPPEHVKFLFATTDPEKVLPTILSRCQRFDLRQIPTRLISDHLALIAGKEGVEIDPTALYAIARGAEGGMRDAESTLDQLISFCGNHIEEADVLSMFGLTAQGQLLELARAVLAGETETGLRQLTQLTSSGKDLGRLLSDLLSHFRNLLLFQVSRGDANMLEVSEAEAAAIAEQSKLVSAEALTRILEVFGDAEMRLRDASSRKILVEITLLKAIEARNAVSVDSLLKYLQGLRSGAAIEPPKSPASSTPPAPRNTAPVSPVPAPAARPAPPAASSPQPKPAPASAPKPEPPAATLHEQPAPASSVTELPQIWANLIEAVGRVSPFARTYLLEAHPVSLTARLFTIGVDPEHEDHLGLVDTSKNHELIMTKMKELGFPGLQVKFVIAERPQNLSIPAPAAPPVVDAPRPAAKTAHVATAKSTPLPPPPAAAAPPSYNKNDFKNDPLIKKALEVFKGQIVDVRA
jgi:DNA polymerase-3 subunit gamma/tau